jgi:endonuclease/exonuclease/phosphatase (EEP) superfamily protein YafD
VPTPRRSTSPTPARVSRVAIGYAGIATLVIVAWGTLGDTWWLQPLNLTTFWWSLPAVPVALVAALRRRPATAAVLAIPAMVWVWSYGALFLPSSPPALRPDLRVVTFNTYVHREGIDHVTGLVAATNPDVLLLQEVFPPRQQQLEAALAARYPHHLTIQSPGVGGVMVLSRHPIVGTSVSESAPGSRATEVVVLDVAGRLLQVVSVHLISPCPRCGPSWIERLELEGDRREAEMAGILRALRVGVPTIVGGDFNSNERSRPYRQLVRAGFQDPHRAVGSGPGFTWPDDGPVGALLRVDWILSRGITPVSAWVGDGNGSDHRPVVVDFAFS